MKYEFADVDKRKSIFDETIHNYNKIRLEDEIDDVAASQLNIKKSGMFADAVVHVKNAHTEDE